MGSTAETPREYVRTLLKNVLTDAGGMAAMTEKDLDLTIRAARRERLLGTLALRVKAAGKFESLPPNARDQLQSAQVLAESRARLARWELNRIALALTGTKTRCIVMKGCAYLLLERPFAKGRIFADVDLMLPERDLYTVEEQLNEQGWQSQKLTAYDQNYYRKWTHELPPLVHVEREVEVDLHHNLLPRTARLKPDAEKLLAAVKPVPGSDYYVLGDEDMVLHAITHLMFNDDLGDKLRELVDIDALLRFFSTDDEDFWPRLIARAEELDLRRATFYGFRYVTRFIGTQIPAESIAATRSWGPLAPTRWLMDRLVPEALFPPHPDHGNRYTEFCRLLLYMRSHWIRMPPWLLAYHLTYKFLVRRFSRRRTRQAAS